MAISTSCDNLMQCSNSIDVPTACDDMMQSPVQSIAFEVDVHESHASSPSIPKRVRRRLLETAEHRSRSPSSLQEIEAKLKEAKSRRQQFHEWLANKAKPKTKTHLHPPQTESLGHRLQTKLIAAEQKRLDLLVQEQSRLARSHELRAAAKIEVQLRAEREREELESRVVSRVQQAETNRLVLLQVEKQKRAAAHDRMAHSIVQRTSQEGKDRERIEALRVLICQRIAAADEKRESRLKAERTRAQASVLQARRVAKAISKKRELESRNKKEMLEARLQKAKKRRADYLGQRCHHNDNYKMKKHGEQLCRKLTRCWRRFQRSRQTTLKLAHDVVACSINQHEVVSLPFEEVVARITSPLSLSCVRTLLTRLESRFFLSSASRSNIAQIDHLLRRLFPVNRKAGGSAKRTRCRNHAQETSESCKKMATNAHMEPDCSTGMSYGGSSNKEEKRLDRYPVRVFLCAYMILGHPDAVFSGKGEREDALSKAALKLILEFETLVSTVINGPGSTCHTRPSTPSFTSEVNTNSDGTTRSFAVQLAEFDAVWGSYLYQFVAWKMVDAHLLEEDLIKVACQLELSMLQKCCLTSHSAGVQASLDNQAIQQQVLQDHQLLKERVMHLTGSAGAAKMHQALSETRTHFFREQEKGSLQHLSLFSPQEPCLAPDMTNERTWDNEQMVNEILHEPNWILPDLNKAPCKLTGVQAQIKATMEDAFWNVVMEGLVKDPPLYERVIELLKEVKVELENIAPGSWKQEIHEYLDVQLFSQVLESGSQDYAYFQNLLEYALGIVMKLAAPARDRDARKSLDLLLKELSQISTDKGEKSLSLFNVVLVKGLRFVLEQIQILKADISAARIQALEPIIQGSAGIDYMRRLFAKHFSLQEANVSPIVDSVHEKLPKTAAWLKDVQQTLELEKSELESLRNAHRTTISETESCIPPISSMRTGARVVIGSTSNSPISSPGLEHKSLLWNSMQTLVALGLVHTLCRAQALTEDTIIETLRLNVHRLRKAQNDFQHLVIMATGLLLLRQSCATRGLKGADLESLLNNCKTELDTLLKNPEVNILQIGFFLAKFSSDGDKQASDSTLETNGDLLSRVLNRSLAPEDVVFKRVSAAVQTSLRAIILLGQGVEGLAVVNMALQPIGVTCLQEMIVNLGNCIQRVVSVTCSVHEPWYACMLASN